MTGLQAPKKANKHVALLVADDGHGRLVGWKHPKQMRGELITTLLELAVGQHLRRAHVRGVGWRCGAPRFDLCDEIHALEALVHEACGRDVALTIHQDQGGNDQ